jgi:hypothetical protein
MGGGYGQWKDAGSGLAYARMLGFGAELDSKTFRLGSSAAIIPPVTHSYTGIEIRNFLVGVVEHGLDSQKSSKLATDRDRVPPARQQTQETPRADRTPVTRCGMAARGRCRIDVVATMARLGAELHPARDEAIDGSRWQPARVPDRVRGIQRSAIRIQRPLSGHREQGRSTRRIGRGHRVSAWPGIPRQADRSRPAARGA